MGLYEPTNTLNKKAVINGYKKILELNPKNNITKMNLEDLNNPTLE